MRDDPLDAEIPEFQPSNYYAERLAEIEGELARLRKMSDEEAEKEVETAYKKELEENEAWIAKNTEKYDRYQKMLDKVKAWAPPSLAHTGLKNFMIEQIKMCMPDLGYRPKNPKRISGKEWITKKMAALEKNKVYFEKKNQDEYERVSKANEWVRLLKASLE